MTTVSDFITNLNGTPANGRLVINSPPMTVGGVAVAASQIEADIVDGDVTVDVYSNLNAQPTGVYYKVFYELDQGPVYEENWIVPNLPTVNIGQIRAAFPATPSIMINAQQLTSAGASPGQFLGWSGANWTPMYVTSFNYYPNFIGLNVTGAAAPDLAVTGSPASLGSNFTLNVPDAALTSRGVVNTGAQTFGGNKTFQNNVTVVGGLTGAGAVFTDVTVTGHLLATGTSNLLIDPTTTLGDLIARSATGPPQRFGAGANGMILTADSTQPLGLRWGPGPLVDPTTNLGDLIVRSAGAVARLGVGPNTYVLTADSTQPLGMNWAVTVTSVFGRTGAVVAQGGDYTAAQVTNAVSVLGSYADPPWITSLAWSKIQGAPATGVSSVFGRTGAVVAATGDYTAAQVTNAVSTLGSYSDPAWITGLAWSKIQNPPPLFGDPTTTKGDLIVHGTTTTRLPVGTDNWVLTADSTQTLGVRWAPVASGGGIVTSVFGRTGAVIAVTGDYTAAMVTNAVDATQTYSNPAFIGSLAWSKITGAPTFMADPTTTKGDLIVHGTTTTRLPVGPDGQVLTADSSTLLGVRWGAVTAGVSSVFTRTGAVVAQAGDYTAAQVTNAVDSTQTYNNPSWLNTLAWSKITGTPTIYVDPLTTKGDILGHGAATTRIPVGTDGQVLTADSTQALGVKWAAATGGSGSQTPWTSNIVGAGFQLQNAGNIGIGTSTIPLQTPVAGRLYLTIKGSTDGGVLELATGSADADATILGRIAYTDPANNQSDKRAAFIDAYRSGSTVNNRGSLLAFWTRPDGGTTPSERMVLSNQGYLGVGNLTPAHMIDVAGDVNVTGQYLVNGVPLVSGYWQAGSGGAIYYNGGNVGIGTTAPTISLDVAGGIRTTGGPNPTTGAGMELSYQGGTCYIFGYNRSGGAFLPVSIQGLGVRLESNASPLILNGSSSGNVGIGTASPAVLLDLPNYSTSNSQLRIGSMEFQGYALGNSNWTENLYFNGSAWTLRNTGTGSYIAQNATGVYLATAPSGAAGSAAGISTRFCVLNGGNVGIGATAPGSKLHIYGAANENIRIDSLDWLSAGMCGINVVNDANNANVPFGLIGSPIALMGGNVGIGTTSPVVALDVASGGVNASAYRCGATAGGDFSSQFTVAGGNTYLDYTGALNVRMKTTPGGITGTAVVVTATGNVGIGTTSPTGQLTLSQGSPGGYQFALSTSSPNAAFGITIDALAESLIINDMVASVNRLTIQGGTGFVGIAIQSPKARLHVEGATWLHVTTNAGLYIQGSAGALLVQSLSDDWSAYEPLAINASSISFGCGLTASGNINITGQYQINGVPINTSGGPTTWAVFNASQRPIGTTFTNSTGKPVHVCACVSVGSQTTVVATVAGNTACQTGVGGSGVGGTFPLSFIVLPGQTYSINTGTFQSWVEWW